MRYVRMAAGLLVWVAAGVGLSWSLREAIFAPQENGHRVAADLWNYASADRRMVRVQLDDAWPVEVGDPIYRVDGPDAIEQVGEIRRVLTGPEAAALRVTTGPAAEALLYPNAPVLCSESYLTYYTTPRSLSWVMETMLPPEKRIEIAQEIIASYEAYHAEILAALRPVIVGGFQDALEIVEEDLARAVDSRREMLEKLGSRYQERVVEQELIPLIRHEIWPTVRRHAEPLANRIGEEMFRRASLWRFGWRVIYDRSPLPEKNLTREEWNRFVNEEALPVLNEHAADILSVQRRIVEDIANNQKIRDVLRRNVTRVFDDPDFRAIVWDILREVLVDNPRLHARLEERWNGAEARAAVQLASDYVEPSVRRIGDILLGTREQGISPEFAQVLRNQILDKDCRWLVLESPPDAAPINGVTPHTVLRVRVGGYPEVNPFAVQLQGGSR